MIDTYSDGVQSTVEKIKTFFASPTGIFLYAFFTGAVGIVLLLAFLSMIVTPSVLPMALPAIIAFNCAAGGYSLTDKNHNETSLPKISLGMIATLLTITGCTTIVVFSPWEALFDSNRYLICGISALIFTFFGAWIASKSKKINRS
ncbi:MAG: FtsH-binding integral membrane protein [Desulforhopalus sp.]|jgi:FtsH-binding integral membrane protein